MRALGLGRLPRRLLKGDVLVLDDGSGPVTSVTSELNGPSFVPASVLEEGPGAGMSVTTEVLGLVFATEVVVEDGPGTGGSVTFEVDVPSFGAGGRTGPAHVAASDAAVEFCTLSPVFASGVEDTVSTAAEV